MFVSTLVLDRIRALLVLEIFRVIQLCATEFAEDEAMVLRTSSFQLELLASAGSARFAKDMKQIATPRLGFGAHASLSVAGLDMPSSDEASVGTDSHDHGFLAMLDLYLVVGFGFCALVHANLAPTSHHNHDFSALHRFGKLPFPLWFLMLEKRWPLSKEVGAGTSDLEAFPLLSHPR